MWTFTYLATDKNEFQIIVEDVIPLSKVKDHWGSEVWENAGGRYK